MRLSLTLAACFAIAACGSSPSEPDPALLEPAAAAEVADTRTPDEIRAEAEAALAECKGADWLDEIGKPGAPLALELPQNARIIKPGSIITQDYNPQRINVDLDQAGNVSRIWCG